MRERRVPERMCIACRQMYKKTELKRIVKQSGGAIFVDDSKKADGRGAYLCGQEACLAKLKKARLLNRVWKMEIPVKIYEQLEESFVAKE